MYIHRFAVVFPKVFPRFPDEATFDLLLKFDLSILCCVFLESFSVWDDGQQNTLWKWNHSTIINRNLVDSCIFNVVLRFKRLKYVILNKLDQRISYKNKEVKSSVTARTYTLRGHFLRKRCDSKSLGSLLSNFGIFWIIINWLISSPLKVQDNTKFPYNFFHY